MTKEQEETRLEEFKVTIQNKNPKKDPIIYDIRTITDITNCITSDNIDGFLKDFKMCLHTYLLMQEINDAAIKQGTIPEGNKILMPFFKWIDDWKPKRTRKKK